MKNYIKQAKDEGLNWQAIIIEETESDLKVLIKNAVIYNMPFNSLNARITRLVNEAIEDFTPNEFKERSRRLLLDYATEQYWQFKQDRKSVV